MMAESIIGSVARFSISFTSSAESNGRSRNYWVEVSRGGRLPSQNSDSLEKCDVR